MFSFLKKKKSHLFSPTNGVLIPLSQVNDPVFAQGMMGPGCAIQPESDNIYSPIEGTVTSIFPTKHAISLTTNDGKALLLHIGIDTVDLDGLGFNILISENQSVTPETLLATFDRQLLKEKGKEDTLMLLFPEEKSTFTVTEKKVSTHDIILDI